MISEIENQESIECHKNQETMGFKKDGCIKLLNVLEMD